jgi:cytoskeletal protein RodZ
MYAPAGNITGFTGVLIRRHYKPGQRYIQLLFQTKKGLRLSISRNLQLVRSLSVGSTYRVKGQEYIVGEKTYIHEPTAALVKPKKILSKRRVLFFVLGIVLILIGVASAMVFTKNGSANHTNTSKNTNTSQQPSDTTTTPQVESDSTTQDQPSTTPPASSTTQTKQTTTAKTTSPAAVTPPPSSTPDQSTAAPSAGDGTTDQSTTPPPPPPTLPEGGNTDTGTGDTGTPTP